MRQQEDIVEEATLAQARAIIQNAIDRSGMNPDELRKKLGFDRSFIPSLLSGDRPLTVRLMAAILFACGFEVRFSIEPVEVEP